MRFGLLSALVLSSALACGGSGATPGSPAPLVVRDGKYSFRERPAGTDLELEGTFIVLADTVMVDATPGPCHYDSRSTRGGPITYRCAETTVSFDRLDPVHRAGYTFTTIKTTSTNVCDRYEVNAAGARVCVSSHVETKDVPVQHSGTLRPVRVGDAAVTP